LIFALSAQFAPTDEPTSNPQMHNTIVRCTQGCGFYNYISVRIFREAQTPRLED